MSIDDKLAEKNSSVNNGIEGKLNFSLKDAWKQMNWKEKFMIGASTFISAAITGPILTASTGIAYMATYKLLQKKMKKSVTKKGFLAEGIFSNLSSLYGFGMYKIFNKLTSFAAKMAFGFGAMIPLSYALYFPMKHLLHNYTMKQFVKKPVEAVKEGIGIMKENFWRAYKKSLLYLPLPLGAFWYLTPPSLQPVMHTVLGGAGRVFMKYTVDKDIKPITNQNNEVNNNPKIYSLPNYNYNTNPNLISSKAA